MSKFHWHGAWCSSGKSFTHDHRSCKRWRDVRTGSSSLNFFQTTFAQVVTASSQSGKHATKVAEGSYHQLIRSNLNYTLRSAINRAGISNAPCTPIIRIWCQLLKPTAFLMHPEFAAIAVCAVLLTPEQQTMHGNSPELCKRSRPLPQIMTLFFLHFLLHGFPYQEPCDTFSIYYLIGYAWYIVAYTTISYLSVQQSKLSPEVLRPTVHWVINSTMWVIEF